jgi:hypothetical protein
MKNAVATPRIRRMPFGSVYPLYVQKVERKGRTQAEVDEVLTWLTGYDTDGLRAAADSGVGLEEFFDQAPAYNPAASLVTGLICGYRVEEIEDPLMRRLRCMDKIVDELARGKAMTSILRTAESVPTRGAARRPTGP